MPPPPWRIGKGLKCRKYSGILGLRRIYLIGKKRVGLKNSRLNFLVGRKFSQSPIITIENKGFEIFSRSKF